MEKLDKNQILLLEPRLVQVERYALDVNSLAKEQNIPFHELWSKVKQMSNKLIGWNAEKPELQNEEAFDLWRNYIISITTECK